MRTFSEILSTLREKTGKNQGQIAGEMGINSGTLSGWKKRKTFPVERIIAYCEKFNLDLEEVILGTKKKVLPGGEHGGSWVGLEGLSREQREIIEMISRDRIFARSFMMMYETIVSRYREVREPGPPFPSIEPGPGMAIASGHTIKPDEPPKEE